MSTDLTFITNEEGNKLVDRFSTLIKHSRLFDCLVGYFYVTGFCSLYKALEETEKIRILVGISTDSNTFGLIQESKEESLQLSHKETKDLFSTQVIQELSGSDESLNVEEGINKFIEWIKAKPPRLEIHVCPTEKIHAKLYILTFKDGEMDKGRVITGSSNFTRSGLRENLESKAI